MRREHDQVDPAEALMREVGVQLRAVRLERGEELEAIAQYLRIREAYLEAIEQGDMSIMPGRTYALGFLRSYADHLGFDGDDLVAQIKSTVADLTDRTRLHIRTPLPENRLPKVPILVLSLAAIAGVYAGWSYLDHSGQVVLESVGEIPEGLRGLARGALPPGGLARGALPPEGSSKGPGQSAETTVATVPTSDTGSPPATGDAGPPTVELARRGSELGDRSDLETGAPAPASPAAMGGGGPPGTPKPGDLAEPVPTGTTGTVGAPPAVETEDPAARLATPGSAERSGSSEVGEVGAVAVETRPLGPDMANGDDRAVVAPPVGVDGSEDAPEANTPAQPAPEPGAGPDGIRAARAADGTASGPVGPGVASIDPGAGSPSTGGDTVAAPVSPRAPMREGGPDPEGSSAPSDVVAASEMLASVLDPTTASVSGARMVHEPQNTDARVILRALDSSWVRIASAGGDYLRTRTLQPGDTFLVPNRDDLHLWTGNAGGLEVIVDGDLLPPLGTDGAVIRDIPLSPEGLRALVAGDRQTSP